jgi:hypothetical protein
MVLAISSGVIIYAYTMGYLPNNPPPRPEHVALPQDMRISFHNKTYPVRPVPENYTRPEQWFRIYWNETYFKVWVDEDAMYYEPT